MSEKWKTIKDYPDYEVSDQGQIRSWKRKKLRILRPCLDTYKYLTISLYKNGTQNNTYVHSLVLETFISSRPKKMEACHNDGNKSNNYLNNLRWDSHENNQADTIKHGTSTRGTKSPNCKLTKKQVLEIRKDSRILRLIRADYKVCNKTIYNIKTQRKWSWLKN